MALRRDGDTSVNSRQRVQHALNHREPDWVPFDLGGTGLSTIHVTAYQNLRRHLELSQVKVDVAYLAEQLALVDEELANRLQTDIRPVRPGAASSHEISFQENGAYRSYFDEWGIGWRMPRGHGFFPFPDPLDDGRFSPLRARAEAAAQTGKAVALAGPSAGVAEIYSWLRGYEQYYVDLALNQEFVAYMLDRLVEFKCAFWERALQEIGDLVDVVVEADDLGGQQALIMSTRTYRQLIKPRHKRLFSFIKEQAPVKLFYHTCGAVRQLLPDLIDAGIDILNPVQISAKGMEAKELKREFGRDLVFWGGGVDTQWMLGNGTPQQIRDHVRANIDTLAPGGGFVFAAVHDIQADVPPENIMAMWEAWREFGTY